LVTATIGLEPGDDVGVQTHGDGFLRGPIELADFGNAPIENRGRIRKINVFVPFCRDGADVVLLFLGELLIGSPFMRLGGASRDDSDDLFVLFLIECMDPLVEPSHVTALCYNTLAVKGRQVMSKKSTEIVEEALSLPPPARAQLADLLLSSLDSPSEPIIDGLWAQEAEDRIDAFERGEIRTVSSGEALEAIKRPKP